MYSRTKYKGYTFEGSFQYCVQKFFISKETKTHIKMGGYGSPRISVRFSTHTPTHTHTQTRIEKSFSMM